MAEPDVFRLLLIGDSSVGKTSLLLNYTEGGKPDNAAVTNAVDCKTKDIVIDGRTFRLQIWDTAGQERFRTITSSYYRGAHGIIVVYDVTEQSSFNNVSLWLREIQRYAVQGVSRVLVGNKTDLNAIVPTSAGQQLASQQGIPFIEASAMTGNNVDNIFESIAMEVYRSNLAIPRGDAKIPPIVPKKKCC